MSSDQEENQISQNDGWTIHPSIDASLGNDKLRKVKSDDPGWKYSWWPNLNDKNMVQCLLCAHISRGGIKRLKEHLTGGFSDVIKCPKTTVVIREEITKWRNKGIKRKMDSTSASTNVELNPIREGKAPSSCASTGTLKKAEPLDVVDMDKQSILNFVMERQLTKTRQTSIEDHFKKQQKEVVDEFVADFIYENGLSFNLVTKLNFTAMAEAMGRYGRGYIPPSMYHIRKPLLEKRYEDVASLQEDYASHWKKYGVTLRTDGWTDRRGRSLLNFLVNCPEGTFFLGSVEASSQEKNADYLAQLIEEHMKLVGVENVVQICTDNAFNYVLAGKKLIDRYPSLFWTPCAAHCFDLLLEDIGRHGKFKKIIGNGRKITSYIYSHCRLHDFFLQKSNKKKLVRCGVTRFATSFLTLQSLFDMKNVLRTVFLSDFWSNSSWAKDEQGKFVAIVVLSTRFWEVLEDCLRASQPILAVLRLVDSDEKPIMGYILPAIEKAITAIKENFAGKQEAYQPILDLLNRRFEMHFSHPLFGAGAFLNPTNYYQEIIANPMLADKWKAKFQDCVNKMLSEDECDKLVSELDEYRQKRGRCGTTLAQRALLHLEPLSWWDSYGVSTPTLKKIAIRILGLTCTTSNCERNWSTFEIIQNKRRTNLDPVRLSKLVFIKYNKALYERFQRRRIQNKSEDFDPICVNELNYSSEWMTGEEGACNEFVYEEDGLTWAEVDEAMGAIDSFLNVRPRTTSTVRGRGRGRGELSTAMQTYKRKGKEIAIVEDEDDEDEFANEFDVMMDNDEDE